jgi:serpin B
MGSECGRAASVTGWVRDLGRLRTRVAKSSSAELNKPLEALGMRTAFSDGADFSNMTPTDNLTISHVIQDAHIEVDEKGTQATAATAVLGETLSRPPTLNVDRPFLFTITDDATGAVLFLGRVANPNAR